MAEGANGYSNGNAAIVKWLVGVVGTLATLGIAGMVAWNFDKVIDVDRRVTTLEAATPVQLSNLATGQQKRYTSDDAARDKAVLETEIAELRERLNSMEARGVVREHP